jgi:hypothetical protein
MKNNLTINQVDAVIKLIERRYLLAERFPEKYNQLNNNLHDICKTLEISDAEIKEMEGKIENKEFSMDETPEEKKAKTIVKNYNIHGTNVNLVKPSLSVAIIQFFKNITVVDFMLLNKKAVVFLLMLCVLAIVVGYALYMPNIMSASTPVEERIKNLINFLNLEITSLGLIIGLVLPLLIKNILSYAPILLGFTGLLYYILHIVLDTASINNNTIDLLAHLAALGLTIIYGFIISKLRKKYIFKLLVK